MVHIRRAELIGHYEQSVAEYTTPGARAVTAHTSALHRVFCPAAVRWEQAGDTARNQARQAARRQIQQAQAALSQQRSFEDIALEFSKGPMAVGGGDWGMIGKPLKPPLDAVTQRVFTMSENQVSGLIETETGCYLVKCGAVKRAVRPTFADVQNQGAREARRRAGVNALSNRHMAKLAMRASMSSLEDFIAAAIDRAGGPTWP